MGQCRLSTGDRNLIPLYNLEEKRKLEGLREFISVNVNVPANQSMY